MKNKVDLEAFKKIREYSMHLSGSQDELVERIFNDMINLHDYKKDHITVERDLSGKNMWILYEGKRVYTLESKFNKETSTFWWTATPVEENES